jgi:hypothetical protein
MLREKLSAAVTATRDVWLIGVDEVERHPHWALIAIVVLIIIGLVT